MPHGLRRGFRPETVAGSITGCLAVVTLFWHDWMQAVFEADVGSRAKGKLASGVECLPPTTRRFLRGTGSRSSPMARHMTGSAGNPVRLHLYGSGCVSTTRYSVSNFL